MHTLIDMAKAAGKAIGNNDVYIELFLLCIYNYYIFFYIYRRIVLQWAGASCASL